MLVDKELTKNDWRLISEALCFASKCNDVFEGFLKQRNGESFDLVWKEGVDSGGHGHALIGYCFQKIKNMKGD